MTTEKLEFSNTPVKVLAINASNRKDSNSRILLEKAVEALTEQNNVAVRTLDTFNKHYSKEDKNDDFDELLEKWRWADAIVLSMPVYTAAGPGLIYKAFDRLASALDLEIRSGQYTKVGAFIVQGSETWGMVELALENAIDVFASLHCLPVYRLAGRVPDKKKPNDPRMFEQISELSRELVEISRILQLGYESSPSAGARVLVINAGVDDEEIGDGITARIEARLGGIPGITAETFRFAGKKFEDCHHCNTNCGKNFQCIFKDGFQEFFEKWLWADGLLWVSSANQPGPPAVVRCAHDRLSEVGFSTVLHRSLTQGVPYRFSKYTRPEACVIYGRKPYGGQSWAQQFFINTAVQRGNFFLTGRDTNYPFGPAALLRSSTQLGCDQTFTGAVDALSDDVADLSRRVQTAKQAAFDSIPELYYHSRHKMGITDKEAYIHE